VAREAKGRCGDPSGGLTLGEEAVTWARGGGEQSSMVEGWWRGLPYIGSRRRGGGRHGGEWSAEVWFKGGELRGRLLGRGRGGGAS
jgi:hypothetical protein